MLNHSLNHRSRMRRESHVRFCERWGVKFPLSTRLKFGNMNGAKGLNCPALSNESTRDGKNEIERAMTREWCFISPSRLDNKSRMR